MEEKLSLCALDKTIKDIFSLNIPLEKKFEISNHILIAIRYLIENGADEELDEGHKKSLITNEGQLKQYLNY